MKPDTQEVELTVSISDEDTVFIDFDGGGKAKVESIDNGTITILGDNSSPTPLEQWEKPTTENFTWKAELPIDDKGTWEAFINSIQVYDL